MTTADRTGSSGSASSRVHPQYEIAAPADPAAAVTIDSMPDGGRISGVTVLTNAAGFILY